jgi:hypothetical protein
MSWSLKDTFLGKLDGGGKVEDEMSYPTKVQVEGSVLATSKSQIPVPVAMSPIFILGAERGMFGCTRKPNVLVTTSCCWYSLLGMVSRNFSEWVEKIGTLTFSILPPRGEMHEN